MTENNFLDKDGLSKYTSELINKLDNKYLNMSWEDTTFECVMSKSSCKKKEERKVNFAFFFICIFYFFLI